MASPPLSPNLGANLNGPLNSHPPDGMSDDTLSRRNTITSSSGFSDKTDTCRICRSEATDDDPLFYPCKCSGSIKYVHQDCLIQWLNHSNKKHCELCKTPFRFTKLYDAQMPEKLPWNLFVRRACVHTFLGAGKVLRGALVAIVWLIVLPWLVRWAWRWMFWFADAGWARQVFITQIEKESLGQLMQVNETDWSLAGMSSKVDPSTSVNFKANDSSAGPTMYNIAKNLIKNLGLESVLFNSSTPANSSFEDLAIWSRADASLFSSFTYLAELTPSSTVNRIILDITEGQLITCVVITGFILVFLIREWVVQQQPLVNLENLGNVNQQLREAAERVQAENERLRRQQELLQQARRRLVELQQEYERDLTDTVEEYLGWEEIERTIDLANQLIGEHADNADPPTQFKQHAYKVMGQLRSASRQHSHTLEAVTEKLTQKLVSLPPNQRKAWEEVLMACVKQIGPKSSLTDPHASLAEQLVTLGGSATLEGRWSGSIRPPMPDRDFSSRAMQIQRLLEETEGMLHSHRATLGIPLNVGGPEPDSMPARPASAPLPETTSAGLSSSENFDHSEQPTPVLLPPSQLELGEEAGSDDVDEMPITNAGPDAKVNIKIRGGMGKARAIPAPKEPSEADIKRRREEDEVMKRLENVINAEDSGSSSDIGNAERELRPVNADTGRSPVTAARDNPFHPDGPPPEAETLGSRVVSMFREEFGLDEMDQAEQDRRSDTADEGRRVEATTSGRETPTMGYLESLLDWFWGDLQLQNTVSAPTANDERVSDGEDSGQQHQEAQFATANVPAEHPQSQLALEAPPAMNQEEEGLPHRDPEVLAAAQAAGLDADALEEAEDLEGVFELIGFHGPLMGLFQTSTFCTVLVILTVFGAVGVPYTWGKIVLNFLGSPGVFLFQVPMHVIGFATDFAVDLILFIGGLGAATVTKALHFVSAAMEIWLPGWLSVLSEGWTRWVFVDLETMGSIGTRAGGRLSELFLTQEVWDANWAFLGASTSAHASLRLLEEECSAVLNWLGNCITTIVEWTSNGSVDSFWSLPWATIKQLSALPSLLANSKSIGRHLEPLLRSLGIFIYPAISSSTDSVGVDLPSNFFDPSLIYWSATDRFLAVTTGYISIACMATIYVAIDLSITRSETGRKMEKLIRDTLRQAGGVFKVILIISIEMLAFPLYCGLLLDFAFLPLFDGASVATRWAFATDHPTLFGFIHWFIGTCYMFHFALFVGMCRKILRRGVLWFIRDPDDPTFHPVRDVLERGVGTQLRKIAFSALVYGALVILCLGGVIWGIGKICRGIFPIYWISTEPVLEFPMDLLLYNAVTPVLIRLLRPSEAVNTMYAWWLRRCARMLRLSHFLFGDRRKDEEGHVVRKSWTSFLLMRMVDEDEHTKLPMMNGSEKNPKTIASSKKQGDDETIYFRASGKYVLTPCNDQYRPPKPGEAFLHYNIRHSKSTSDLASSSSLSADRDADQDDVYIVDRDGKKNDHFAKVYVPPHFRMRITLFMVCLWIFSAFTGLCATLVPLCFGRQIFASFVMPVGTRVNDIYAYSVGAYVLGGLTFAVLQGWKKVKNWKEGKNMMPVVQLRKWLLAVRKILVRTLKCGYFYGFIVVLLPTLFALVLQFYLVLPLHTYILSVIATDANITASTSAADPTMSIGIQNATSILETTLAENANTANTILPQAPFEFSKTLAQHTIHLLQDYCLGLLYLRLFTRALFTQPTSIAAEAFRRITAQGYFNPDIRLATRVLILPTVLFSIVLLLVPPTACWAVLQFLGLGNIPRADESTRPETVFYRYSYPIAAIVMLVTRGVSGLGKAVEKWRARIKDEVYLVGERLHNFGEKRPAVGSKTLVRKV